MIIQPFSGEEADLDYLLKNPTAKILLGNPDQIAELIRNSPYSRRFTSFVLSFNEDLADEQESANNDANGILRLSHLLAIVTKLRDLIAPEGQSERLAFLAVIHRDKGRTEVHILIANVDLSTGRQYSPYVHRRDAARLRNYQELVNRRCGFSDPEDLDLQLKAMPDPRMGHFSLISKITRAVQTQFQNATHVTVDDVANYLEHAGYRVQRKNSEGKKTRLAVDSKEGELIRLPGVWFRSDFDLAKFRSKKRKTVSELRKDLVRRTARFKELTAKSHRRKSIDFRMDGFPKKIRMPIKFRFFSSFFSVERWEDRKIPIISESLFCGAERSSNWIQRLSQRLKLPIIEIKQLAQADVVVTKLKTSKASPKIIRQPAKTMTTSQAVAQEDFLEDSL